MKMLVLLLLLVLAVPGWATAQETMAAADEMMTTSDDAEREAVRQAALDYVEGIYEVTPARIERSVHPELAKIGYWWSKKDGMYKEGRMTYDELFELAGSWNANGQVDAATAPKEVVILDLMDKTAVVKLTAAWGIDHMHLAKLDGRWMIINVLWQSHTPDAP